MIFCKDCFIDSEIRNIVGKSRRIGNCPICGTKNIQLYDTEIDSSVRDNFNRLFDLYTIETDASKDIPKVAFTSIIEDVIENWQIFNPILNANQIRKILESLCHDKISVDENFLLQKVVIAENYNNAYLKTNCIVETGKWADFSDAIKNKNRFHSKTVNTAILKPYLEGLVKIYPSGSMFYRGRIAEDENGFKTSEIGIPPAKITKSGRANSEGIPRLYLASDDETAIHEIRASMYDYVTLGIFKAIRDVKVINLQNINKLSPFSDYDADIALFAVNKQILHDINNEMAKPVRNNSNSVEYVPTQFIADYVDSLGEYDGIEYMSTMNANGYNLAIFDATAFDCIDVKTVQVNEIKYKWFNI